MKRMLCIDIRGKRKNWTFVFEGDPKYIPEWEADGLHVEELINTVPEWWVDAGLSVRFYCFFQDIFNFRNPFEK